MMKPILFNTEMVRAILDGRKTVTRRVVKPQPNGTFDQHWGGFYKDDEWILLKEPYRPGDILYVRETYFEYAGEYVYRASAAQPELLKGMWHPSIHMPREAARIFLRVTDVRVERLQEIDVDGCKAEGIWDDYKALSEKHHEVLAQMAYPKVFAALWDSIIKPADRERYGWAANPWVWVIAFERCDKLEGGRAP